MSTTPGEGTALRLNNLNAAERREVRHCALRLGDALFAALDQIDELLDMGKPTSVFEPGTVVLTDSERVALGHARTNVLSAFHALKVGVPDLTGLVPTEALETDAERHAFQREVLMDAGLIDRNNERIAQGYGFAPTDSRHAEDRRPTSRGWDER